MFWRRIGQGAIVEGAVSSRQVDVSERLQRAT